MQIRGMRWYMVSLLCLATALNYLDRQTLSLLSSTLEKAWGMTTVQYSYITATWLASYTIMNAVSGRIIDRLGTRRGLATFVSAWTVADALHALAKNVLHFSIFRFFLGAAEAANFPAGVKAVTEWFPVRERAMAVGIFNSGTALGAALAAPIVVWITLHLGWRATFLVSAGMSLLWLLTWLMVYRVPREQPWTTPEERAFIEAGSPTPARGKRVTLREILSRREAWGCIGARILTDPISYLFAFWIPKFLQQERGFDLSALGKYYWIPYVGLGLGNLAGGYFPRCLMQAGWTLNRSRKSVMAVSSVMLAISFILITQVPSAVWAIVLLTIAMFFHAAWANMTLPTEVFPQHVIGSVAGIAGGISSFIGAIITLGIGQKVQIGSFTPIFVIYSVLPTAGFIVVCLLIKNLGEIQRFESD